MKVFPYLMRYKLQFYVMQLCSAEGGGIIEKFELIKALQMTFIASENANFLISRL